jgi:hypothetical protein
MFVLHLQEGQSRNWRSSLQSRDRTCCRPGVNEDGEIDDMQAGTPGWESRHSVICSGVKRSISITATAAMSRMISRLEGTSDAEFQPG